MIKVAKFGGSSVANAEQFAKVRQIVQSDPSRKFIVVSACGKEYKEDHKVTDLLYLCHAHLKYGVTYEPIFSMVESKYRSIAEELHLKTDLDEEFNKIRSIMKKDLSEDYLVSRGEYLTAILMAEYLDFVFLDASKVIRFKYDGSIDLDYTVHVIGQYAHQSKGIVVPGFYGALPNGVIRVMSRGGSDITGSVLANAIDADVYEYWTDVSGFFMADPRIIDHPLQIPRINYNELREMSYMGANVLHDDAVFPVKMKNIPINVRNTNEPDNPGTMIMEDCSEYDRKNPPHFITGITGRKDYTVITIVRNQSVSGISFLRRLLSVFEEFNVAVETLPTTVDTVSVIVASESVSHCLYEIIGRIKEDLAPEDLHMEDHVAIVAIVGRGMKQQPGISGKLISEFGNNGINIKVLSQTNDERCIEVGVLNRDFEKAIQCIYDKFIKEEGEQV